MKYKESLKGKIHGIWKKERDDKKMGDKEGCKRKRHLGKMVELRKQDREEEQIIKRYIKKEVRQEDSRRNMTDG